MSETLRLKVTRATSKHREYCRRQHDEPCVDAKRHEGMKQTGLPGVANARFSGLGAINDLINCGSGVPSETAGCTLPSYHDQTTTLDS